MNYRRITAISLALAVLVFAACDKEGRKLYPSTLPDQKITNIYETTSLIMTVSTPSTMMNTAVSAASSAIATRISAGPCPTTPKDCLPAA